MSHIPSLTLNTGAKIPAIALGTWESPVKEVENAVYDALKFGYRHIDTAAVYANEEGVGAGIRRAMVDFGIKRSEIFVTTKLWCKDFHAVENGLYTSLAKVFPGEKEAYFDLYLMHWPFSMRSDLPATVDPSISFNEVYAAMEKLPTDRVKAIGVSNFTIKNLKTLLSTAKITPAVNQVELHTTLPQPKLVEFLLSGKYGFPNHDGKIILPEAYSPMARGNLSDPTIQKIADSHKCSPANIVLSWGIQRKCVVLPKSVHSNRIKDNLKYIELTKEDVATIDGIAKNSGLKRYCSWSNIGLDVFDDNADSK
ncbi:glycerol 2-dehydrogenase (NADP(+)) [Starmerella bacillaris]|uniref:Glycerol 2-dehydrogenase (NADP(+)) n=1 Tax=Starmerella bacillaris TaxID=1247836 RepID=A0AAV5RN33_STABA|nr:glycerol 2-dehydrogenase (NADP(+)) [Starmerella bacillaris]